MGSLHMRNTGLPTLLFFALLVAAAAPALAGNIVCWKDKTGKTVGCGDTVPPEYQNNASQELDKHGITVKKTDAALTPEQQKAAQEELQHNQEAQRQQEAQRRQDKALLDTFTTPQEIDLKRDRDLQLVQSNLETLQSNMKNTDARLAQLQTRADGYAKSNKPMPQALQDEIDQTTADKTKSDQEIAEKKQEIADIRQKYSNLKQRFIELTGKQ